MATARTRKAADAKPAKTDPEPETTNAPTGEDGPRVEVHTADHAKAERDARAKAEREHAATLRSQHVEGLRTELAFLQRQPKPNEGRIAGVQEQLDRYADEPSSHDIETA